MLRTALTPCVAKASDVTKLRKLWKVTQGFAGMSVDPSTEQHPESKAKVYAIYVHNNEDARTHDHTDVWVDERAGHGWQHYERIEHPRRQAAAVLAEHEED